MLTPRLSIDTMMMCEEWGETSFAINSIIDESLLQGLPKEKLERFYKVTSQLGIRNYDPYEDESCYVEGSSQRRSRDLHEKTSWAELSDLFKGPFGPDTRVKMSTEQSKIAPASRELKPKLMLLACGRLDN